MAKVYMTCGRICSGKTTYASELRVKKNAVLLSVDEITLALFPEGVGPMHDTYVERAEEYLFGKALECVEVGIPVVLDWGFWTRVEREHARTFFKEHGVECEFHYLDIDDATWKQRIDKRNAGILEGKVSAYYVDEGLAAKFGAMFEKPEPEEMDEWVNCFNKNSFDHIQGKVCQ